jgi:hypothetical protein
VIGDDGRQGGTAKTGLEAHVCGKASGVAEMKKPGLEGRRRDVSGEISRKHGNTRISTLREVFGPGFAKGMQGQATLAEVLRAVGIEAISEEDRTLLLKGTMHIFKGPGEIFEVTWQKPVNSKVTRRVIKAESGEEAHRRFPLKVQAVGGKERSELVGASGKPVHGQGARPKKEKPRSEAAFLDEITDWTGDRQEAEHWYRKVPIPAFGNRTADQVHADGMDDELGHYIEGLRSGEFA